MTARVGSGPDLPDDGDSTGRRSGGGDGGAGTARAGGRRRPGPAPEGQRARGGGRPTNDIGPGDRLLDQEALASRLDITERHVRRLVAERRIPFLKVGRFVRFDPADIDAWLARVKVPPRTDTTWGQDLAARRRGVG